jgi:WD40 repeat protein
MLIPLPLSGSHPLHRAIKITKYKKINEVNYVGGNAVTLIAKLSEASLEGQNLSHTIIQGADLAGISLRHTNLTEANLTNATFTKRLGRIISVALSPNNKLLATGDFHGRVCLWEMATGKELITCYGHHNFVNSVVFSLNRELLASASHDGTIKLWNTNTGECFSTLRGHANRVLSVAFSPDGCLLASGGYDQSIKIWEFIQLLSHQAVRSLLAAVVIRQ